MSRRRRRNNAPQPRQNTGQDVRQVIREELAKAAFVFPAGSTVSPQSQSHLAQLGAAQFNRPGQQGGQYQLLPRDMTASQFGPGMPLTPAPLDPPMDLTGRPAPRRYAFEPSVNTTIGSGKLIPWAVLRGLADQVSVIRQCIEIRKSAIIGLDWAFTVDPTRASRMAEADGTTKHQVTASLREKHADLIENLQKWWAYPDRINGWSWSEWVGALLEEQLVLDACAIYPHMTLGGGLHSAEIIDGSTIKPLLDHRGAQPQPPNAAYQQILYGFSRGEFTASMPDDVDGNFVSALYGKLPPSLAADGLIYKVRTRRTHSPYGYSPTEQAIADADLLLKRTAWLRAEYTDGVTPEMMVRTDGQYSPDQLNGYEDIFNADLAGRAELRHRAKFLAAGFEPIFPPGVDSKFSPDLDLHLIRLVCADFAVMPSSIGFVPTSGLGGSGHQQGESDNEMRRGTKPTAAWLVDLVNQISRQWLGMPEELTFQFLGLGDDADDLKESQMITTEMQSGQRTLNETRDSKNLPRFTFPEADQPFVMGIGGNPTYLDPEVRQELAERFTPPALQPGAAGAPPADGKEPPTPPGKTDKAPPQGNAKAVPPGKGDAAPPPPGKKPAAAPAAVQPDVKKAVRFALDTESARFIRYARKAAGGSWRDFEFEVHDVDIAAAANMLGRDGDIDAVKALFEMSNNRA